MVDELLVTEDEVVVRRVFFAGLVDVGVDVGTGVVGDVDEPLMPAYVGLLCGDRKTAT